MFEDESVLSAGRRAWPVVWQPVFLFAAAAAVLTLFLLGDLSWNHAPVPPLDDTFIHFQYAKQLARGWFFRYQDGDPVSTGATSFLYPILLAPFWAAGLRDLDLVWAAHVLNLMGFSAAAIFVWAALGRMGLSRVASLLGGLLVIANGWLAWGVASGMAIGLTAGLFAWSLFEILRFLQHGRRSRLAVALALLGTCRPEGLVLAWAMAAGLFGHRFFELVRSGARPRWRPSWILVSFRSAVHFLGGPIWAGLVVAVAPTVLLALLSGHVTTNGMLVKSHAAQHLRWVRYLEETGRTIAAVPGRLVHSPSAYGSALMLFAVVVAWSGLAAREVHGGEPGGRARPRVFWRHGFLWATASAAVSLVMFYGLFVAHVEHHQRYYMPYVPLAVLLTATGLWELGRRLGSDWSRTLPAAGLCVLVLMGLGSVAEWTQVYAKNASDITRQHLAMVRWIRRNLPRRATLAVNDAGALCYLTDRRCYDVVGLVTNAFRPPGGRRIAAFIWETLERVRPDYAVIYPNYVPGIARLPILKKLHVERVSDISIAGGREKTLYAFKWDQVADAERIWGVADRLVGWRAVDSVDEADRVSERAHGFRMRRGGVSFGGSYRMARFRLDDLFLLDGARVHEGPESFVASGLEPGRDLLLVARVQQVPKGPVSVFVEGAKVADWRIQPDTRAGEAVLQVPGSAVIAPKVRIRLDPRGHRLAVCHVFLFQRVGRPGLSHGADRVEAVRGQ